MINLYFMCATTFPADADAVAGVRQEHAPVHLDGAADDGARGGRLPANQGRERHGGRRRPRPRHVLLGGGVDEGLDNQSAVDLYTQALAENSSDHTILGNRSAANYQLKNYTAALADAEQCIAL